MPSAIKNFIDQKFDQGSVNPASEAAARWAEIETKARETAYYEELDQSGIVADLSHYFKSDKARSQTRLMSDKIADRLERLGMGGYHQNELVRIVAPLSGCVEEIPPYRRNNSIPFIAQQKRSNLLKELIYYVESESLLPGVAFRQWVIHDGPRCQSIDLRERWKKQNRKVREWNKYHAKKYGVYIDFRSNEAGSPLLKAHEKTKNPETGKLERAYLRDENGNRIPALDENGCQTWHAHTHLLVRFNRYVSDSELMQILAVAQKHFGTKKLDSGILREPREVCKYVTKCADLDGISDIDFMRYNRRVKGAHLVQPLGGLRSQIKSHKEQCLKLRARWDAKEQRCFYQTIKNHNQSVITGKKTDGEAIIPHEIHQKEKEDEELGKKALDKCAIIARLNPQAHFSPVSEPLFMVRGRVDLSEFCGREQVREVMEHTTSAYVKGCMAFEAIHGYSIDEFLNGPLGLSGTLQARNFEERSMPLMGSAHNTPENGKSQTKPTSPEDKRASLGGVLSQTSTAPPCTSASLSISTHQKKTKPAFLSEKRASLGGELYQ